MKKAKFFLAQLIILIMLHTAASAQSIVSRYIVHSYDVCGTYMMSIKTSGYAPTQSLKFYWGDGLTDTVPVMMPGGLPTPDTTTTTRHHGYATAGTYTIKVVLYDGAPLDSMTFSHEAEHCNFVELHALVDVNANCLPDTTDSHSGVPSTIAVDSAGVPVDTFAMRGGMFYQVLGGIPGTVYTFRTITPPAGLVNACGSTGIVYDTVPGMPYGERTERHFLYDCSPVPAAFDLGLSAHFVSAVLTGIHRANIMVTNSSCVGVPAMLRFDFSPKYAFDSFSSAPIASYTVTGTTVIADLGSMSIHTPTSVHVYLHPVVTLTPGDTVYTSYSVTPVLGDANPANNSLTRCDTIRLSWDPNRKSVTPTGPIAAGTLLEYMLEFENTGSDTAHNIHIMDTLSDYLDFSTFRAGISTHKMTVLKYEEGGRNIVKFDFPNIMLPDSSHHELCKGMATFFIRAKASLVPGTTIANRAGIYFDINEVVMTNTAYSHIPLPSGAPTVTRNASLVEVYPNPVRDALHIAMAEGAFSSVAIYNILGQQVVAANIATAQPTIDVTSLTHGIYYMRLYGKDGASRTIKFEKQ